MLGVLLVSMALAQAAPPSVPAAPPAQASGYVPHRVYDTRERRFVDFESMTADLRGADVVLIGEQHNDPNTHRLETALLEGLARRGVSVTLSLEMFERDVQGHLDGYLAGRETEAAFLAGSRPWPRYATDYRALVEIARAAGWPVVAANVPRRLASEVARSGLAALDRVGPADRTLAAADLACPLDGYFERFASSMTEHAGADGTPAMDQATVERYYLSQCVKDETMAESIAAVVGRGGPAAVVVHVTGAFHSDFGAGTAERVRRRLPAARVAVVTILPEGDLDSLAPSGDELGRARYLVYTVGAPPADAK